MVKWLNYHHLLYFREVAKLGSIAKASQKLLIGQPSISAQIKQLEENLGKDLFERKNRSLILTEYGKVALAYADKIFEKGEEFIQVMNSESITFKSQYNIGTIDGLAKIITVKVLDKVNSHYKQSFVSLSEGGPDELTDQLLSHNLDILITNSPPSAEYKELYFKKIGSSPICLYGSKRFGKLKRDFPFSINEQPFVMPNKHSVLRQQLEHFFLENNIHYDLVAEAQDSALKKLLGEYGKGIIALPEIAGKKLVRDQKLIKIGKLKELHEDYYLIASKKVIKNPITDYLMFNPII
jgi:LysR family transcriptional activator of nhaA